MTRVAILGAGPAGVGAAWKLREQKKADVVVFERGERVGGNSASFEWKGHHLDFGSHRLHPACDAEILADIKRFLGDELLDRPRHGRIRLLGRWVHFPLKPFDLLFHLHPGFAIGAGWDAVRKMLPRSLTSEDEATFATVLWENLGPTICKHFYFPYAVKLWGLPPEKLSAIQARKRVSAGTVKKLIGKALGALPGVRKPEGFGRFHYPRRGFGSISEAYAREAEAAGAEFKLGHTVTGVKRRDGGWSVTAEGPDGPTTVDVDHVWSTIPITVLVRALDPAPPASVLEAAERISYRSMLLVYLELDRDRFTEFDAHYFPGDDVRITRLSEPKNYAVRTEPAGKTVLCAELPCTRGDDAWSASDEELGRLVAEDLRRSGLPLDEDPSDVTVARLPQAYPVYLSGYEEPFRVLDEHAAGLPDFLTFGRQGLFAHDNTHHALFMAYGAASCLQGREFRRESWEALREVFATHVVED